ncbi:MAG: PD-(D/E)XK nuclease family protein [Paludibacteraceae bacterium]|nr:PD-(D/E)XK nuclease family protein [Paludibacteraceae bacterium]
MTEFLQTVAKHYFDALPRRADGRPDYLQLTDWIFIFPSRRAGLFFGKHLCTLNGERPLLAPQRITIGDLFGLFSDFRVADRTELLFRLYKVYNEVRGQRGVADGSERFENFIFWGEMMLRDFDEVDKYLVPADKLFHNVRDLKELENLGEWDEEIRKLFCEFWHNVAPQSAQAGSAKESFTHTWAILYEVYSRFRQALRDEKIAYEGMRQRDVIERLPFADMDERLSHLPKHIVLVGITAINRAERELLLWLKNRGVLECCWDYADEQVQGLSFVKENLADFGNALTDDEARAGIIPIEQKRLKRMAVPSGVGQTNEAAKALGAWGTADAIHTAVVLPDEHLLDSMLYHLPSEFTTYNVTMGYSLRSTQVATLVDALVELQSNIRWGSNRAISFYYKAVLPILSHAFMLDLDLERCDRLRNRINRETLYYVPGELLADDELFRLIFRRGGSIGYLRDVLRYFLEKFRVAADDETADDEASDEKPDRNVLNRECLIAYMQVLDQLENELKASGMADMDASSVFHLVRKMASGLSVSFSGEPMMGLQVMGVLETRAIDFSRIVILSANEGIVPAKPSQNSFIPNTLRKAFSLPTQIYKDSVFAYHFYRLISRASEVVFLYDSRFNGLQTGEQSRYLMQIEYLTGAKIEQIEPQNRIVAPDEQIVQVEKTADVMAQLDRFRKGGDGKFSATSLKCYRTCPLQFYLSFVRRLSVDDEMDDEMDDSRFGTILHDTLRAFYERFEGQMVMADVLRRAIDDKAVIQQMVEEQYANLCHCRPESGYQQFICMLIAENVRSVLKHDKSLTPFFYLAGEFQCQLDFEVNDSLNVRLKAIYDRLDVVRRSDGIGVLRIVDYKTGSPKLRDKSKVEIADPDDICSSEVKCSGEAFQLLLYCTMLAHLDPAAREQAHLLPLRENNAFSHVEPHLYFTRSLLKEDEESRTSVFDDFESHRESIERQMKAMFEQIYDPNVPFVQTADENNCKYCKFTEICNRSGKK